MANITIERAVGSKQSHVSTLNPPARNIVAALLFLLPLIPAPSHGDVPGTHSGSFRLIVGLLLAQSPKVAKQWEKAVVLRLGRYGRYSRPGSSGLRL